MSNLLIRGLSPKTRQALEKLAKARNLSLNQMTLEMIMEALKKWETQEERRKRQDEAMDRMDAFREAYSKKYGRQKGSIIQKMRERLR